MSASTGLFWQLDALSSTTDCTHHHQSADRFRGQYFHLDGNTWSTNGVRLLRVPGLFGEHSKEPIPPFTSAIRVDKPVARTVSRVDLVAWATVTPTIVNACGVCGGRQPDGTFVQCDVCRGTGECDHCGHECDECGGSGGHGCDSHKLEPERRLLQLDYGRIDRDVCIDRWNVWQVLQLLPGETITVTSGGPLSPIHFESDGWLLVVMPVRADANEAPEPVLFRESEAA